MSLAITSTIGRIQSDFDFVLKGGTAITKAWFEPYRFSYDLDFSLFSSESPRKQYRKYKNRLENTVSNMGFLITNPDSDKHREGGRILVLKLMDAPKYLRIPIKLSVSSIDERPCFEPVKREFKPIVPLPENNLLYSNTIPRIKEVSVKVLAPEELCAEKIRALATRGESEKWSLLLRDVVDLHEMDREGVLAKALSSEKCLKKKFDAVRGTSYWKKFGDFLSKPHKIQIREEDLAIFFNPDIIDEEIAEKTVEKVRIRLGKIF